MMVDTNNDKEKPDYGVYIPYTFIIFFGLLGGIGLILIVLGFFVGLPANLILWIVGILLSILFLWPLIGFLKENIFINKQEMVRYDFLTELKAPQILDCGCGTGRHAIQMAKQMPKGGFLTGIDIYDPRALTGNSLERVRKNAKLEGIAEKTKFMVGSVTDIPFDNESFDVVICMTVLHELRNKNDRIRAFQEIYRVLKPEGIFYMTEVERKSSFLSSGLVAFAFHTRAHWENQLKNHNFKIVKTYNRGSIIEFLTKKERSIKKMKKES